MFVPSLFSRNFIDDFMNGDFPSLRNIRFERLCTGIQTDVKEFPDRYEMELELPGCKKEDIQAELKEGYLTINAERKNSAESPEDGGRYLRRERFVGKCTRSFYVGEDIKEEDIQANFENGILSVTVPKIDPKAQVREPKRIAIR